MELTKDDIQEIAKVAAREVLTEAGYFQEEAAADRVFLRSLRTNSARLTWKLLGAWLVGIAAAFGVFMFGKQWVH